MVQLLPQTLKLMEIGGNRPFNLGCPMNPTLQFINLSSIPRFEYAWWLQGSKMGNAAQIYELKM
jgi:hypothetical protein